MKCPKCNYVSFEYLDTCRKCNRDLTKHKREHHIFAPEVTPLDLSSYLEEKKQVSSIPASEGYEDKKETEKPVLYPEPGPNEEEIDIEKKYNEESVAEILDSGLDMEDHTTEDSAENNDIDLIDLEEDAQDEQTSAEEKSVNDNKLAMEDEKRFPSSDEPIGEENEVSEKKDTDITTDDANDEVEIEFDTNDIELDDPLSVTSEAAAKENGSENLDKKAEIKNSGDTDTLDINEIELE